MDGIQPTNFANFQKLATGQYSLEVKSRDKEFNIDPTPASITFRVLPIWWKSTPFLLLASLAIAIISFLQFRVLTHIKSLKNLNLKLEGKSEQLEEKNEKIEHQRDQLRKKVAQIEKLSQSRLRFFTNITHEFRTPISLILAPLEFLKSKSSLQDAENRRKYYDIIQRNANRLLLLINQILEIYKVEENTMAFSPAPGELSAHVRQIVDLFEGLAQQQHVALIFESGNEALWAEYDQDKIEKILFNLLSNAFKNVPSFGEIKVKLKTSDRQPVDGSKTAEPTIVFSVTDNGRGIPQEYISKVFDRFFHYENDGNVRIHKGTGIGLSYIKDLCKTHHGAISVESDPGVATTFTLYIPYIAVEQLQIKNPENPPGFIALSPTIHSAVADLSQSLIQDVIEEEQSTTTAQKDEKPKLLVVDDDSDMRTVLRMSFEHNYQIFEAKDGLEALNLARKENPELIISDIMMAAMDGIELCKKLKNDFNTSHIPIILLSAKTRAENKINGYESGADGYVEKPFNVKLLKSRVHTLIRNRNTLIKRFLTDINLKPEEMAIASVDEIFIQHAVKCVERHMDDESLDADSMAKEIGVSRIQLYRKIKSISGQTVNEFIKSIRLKHAARLLMQKQLTISQIAYSTGFSAPNHFATYFKKHFGTTPTAYVQQNLKKDSAPNN
ncbi:MAG: response regulator [Cyclobacteriaceae bacterium]|nr:response regulator [Cyclobacteriaceae bacterium]